MGHTSSWLSKEEAVVVDSTMVDRGNLFDTVFSSVLTRSNATVVPYSHTDHVDKSFGTPPALSSARSLRAPHNMVVGEWDARSIAVFG